MTRSILVFGATSMLGYQLAKQYPNIVHPFISPGNTCHAVRHWPVLRLNKKEWLVELFRRTQPAILLYCHAVCDVPKCEAHPDWAYEINVEQVDRVLSVLPNHTRLVYVSSDHVFGGDGIYHEESQPCPISVYGKTRVEAEQVVLKRTGSLVIRAGLGIGASPDGRTGHLDWLRYRTQRNLPITIIEDEYRSVVWLRDLVRRVMQLAQSTETGIGHVSATRVVSRVELANSILSMLGIAASFNMQSRHQQPVPHLGRVELATVNQGDLFQPLRSVLETGHSRSESKSTWYPL